MLFRETRLEGEEGGTSPRVFAQLNDSNTLIWPGQSAVLLEEDGDLRLLRWDQFGQLKSWGNVEGETFEANKVDVETDGLEAVEAILCASAGNTRILDFALVENKGKDLFIVPESTNHIEALQKSFDSLEVAPDAIHFLSQIPRTDKGTVDLVGLSKTPRFSASQLFHLEESLLAEEGIESAAILHTNRTLDRGERLHIRQFLPTGQSREAETTPAQKESVEEVNDGPLAHEQGPALSKTHLPSALPQLLEYTAAHYPDKELLFIDGSSKRSTLTYAALLAQARRIAASLRAAGARDGDNVLLQLKDRREFLCGIWGCWLADLVAVPGAIAPSYADRNQGAMRIALAQKSLGDPIILASNDLVKPLEGLADLLDVSWNILDYQKLAAENYPIHKTTAGGDKPVLMLMTSGSTGKPKLVQHSHNTLIRRTEATVQHIGWNRGDRSLVWLPLDHVASIVDFHLRDVYLGCEQVQVDTNLIMGEPAVWLDLLSETKATNTWAPNFAYALAADCAAGAEKGRWDLSHFRFAINGGEAIVVATARRWLAALKPFGLPDSAMLPVWGMSETSSGVTYTTDFRWESSSDDDPFMDLGTLIPDFEMRIVNGAGQVVAQGQEGRLQVRGCGLMLGYYQADAANAESFDGEGWFRTGDLAKIEEGRLVLTGREKDVIIIHGLNYYCHEIESVAEETPGLAPSFTAACAVRSLDGHTESLAIFCHTAIRDRDGLRAMIADLRNRVLQQVGLFPTYVIPLEKSRIPKTGIGKIQRTQLRNAFRDGAFDEDLIELDLILESDQTFPSFFHKISWQPKAAKHGLSLEGSQWTIIGEGRLANRLCQVLKGSKLLSADKVAEQGFENVLFLGGGVGCDERHLLEELLAVFRACHDGAQHRIIFVDRLSQATNPDELELPKRSLYAPMLQSLQAEVPNIQCRHVDLQIQNDVLDLKAVLYEMSHEDNESLVCYRKGRRLVQRFEAQAVEIQQPRIQRGQCYVITGGLGGVGRELASMLLNRFDARLVLIGRGQLDERRRQLIQGLGHASRISYQSADVSSAQALRHAIMEGELELGMHISGAFHLAAGLYQEQLVNESAAKMVEAFQAKLLGAQALHSALLHHHAFLVCFSSVMSRFGAANNAAYAMANRALESLCHGWRRENPRRIFCPAFSMWEERGMSQGYAHKDATRAAGFHVLNPQTALAATLASLQFEGLSLIGLDESRLPIARKLAGNCQDLHQATAYYVGREPQNKIDGLEYIQREEMPLNDDGSLNREQLRHGQKSSGAMAKTPLQKHVAALFCEVLDLNSVTLGDNFFQMGGHSILALQLLNSVRDSLGVTIMGPTFLGGPTVAQLCEQIEAAMEADGDDQPASSELPQITPNAEQRHESFPLTEIQQAYWLGRTSDFELGDVAMHLYIEVDATDLEPTRLQAALNGLIKRHDMLRAVIDETGNERILAEVPKYMINEMDFRGCSPTELENQLQAQRDELSHQKIPADIWPAFDIRLAQCPAGKQRLFISFGATHIDGGSFFLIMTEWGQRYRNPDMNFPELELSYRDYSLALNEVKASGDYQSSLDYWSERLPKLPPAPSLPYAKPFSALRDYRFHHRQFRIPAATWDSIKRIAGKLGLSRSAVGAAAYGMVLANWSRSAAHTLNVTLFNRLPLHPQVGEIAGDFTSMVLLAVEPDGEDTFESLTRRVQERMWTDIEHRKVSGVTVLRELARQRRQAGTALMPVIYTSALDLEMGGASSPYGALRDLGEIAYQMSQTPQVILDLQLFEDDGDLLCMMDSVDEAFPAEMPSELIGAMEGVLRSLEREAAWKNRPQLLPTAQAEMRHLANQTQEDLAPTLLHQLFLDQAERTPNHLAVIDAHTSMTYVEVRSKANRLARQIREAGAMPNQLVAIALEKSADQVVSALAIQIAGAAYLPMDPHLPDARRDDILSSGAVEIVLTTSAFATEISWPEGVSCIAVDRVGEGSDRDLPSVQTHVDLAYVIFTSGSTGKPKGVMINHQGAANTCLDINRRFDIGEEDRIFALSALSFDLSVYDIYGSLAAGAALVIPHPQKLREPQHWLDLAREHHISVWNSVPALMDMFTAHCEGLNVALPPSLRLVMMSGDWIPVTLPDRIRATRSDCTVISMGGATEASIWSIIYPIENVQSDWTSIPYGKAMVNQSWFIFNDHMEPTPTFVPGHLYIGGIGVALGYWGDKERTAASFVTHPQTGERLYRTGDMGRYLPDGNIEFLGREDFQVKIQGYRIELGDIEANLLDHEAIDNAVVVAVGRDRNNRRLVCHYVASDATLESETLSRFLESRLPAYMIPSAFVAHECLPLSSTGKVDRGALMAEDVHADGFDVEGQTAPETKQQVALQNIWASLMEMPQLAMNDDLLRLGCNSLTAIKGIAAMRDAFGVEVPLRLILSGNATLLQLDREILALLDESDQEGLPKAVHDATNLHQPFHLNAIQEAYWIGRLDSFELGGVAAYFYLEVDVPDLDVSRLQDAFMALLKRHDMLRTVFLSDGRQQILASVPHYEIVCEDLRHVNDGEREQRLGSVRKRMEQQVFAADTFPLFELRVSQLPGDVGRIHFGLDLLLADAWSVQIIFRDLETFYRTPEAAPPALEISFRDYLIAEQALVETSIYKDAQKYWWDRLDLLPAAPQLPMVQDFAAITEPHFSRCATTLDVQTWEALNTVARENKISPSGLLLAAFAEVLGAWSRTPHFCLNVTTFNRLPLHPQSEDIVGDFTSLNLLEVTGDGATFHDRANQIQQQLYTDLEHRHVSGLHVLRELSRRRGLKPGALVPIVFTSLLDSYGKSGDFVPLGGDVVFASSQTPQVWLDYQVREEDGILHITWDHIAELLPEGMPQEIFDAYIGLLNRLAREADSWHDKQLQLLAPTQFEARNLANQTQADLPARTLHGPIFKQALATPDAFAIHTSRGSYSYKTLRDDALRLAAALKDAGAKEGEYIGVCLPKGYSQIVAVLATLAAGSAYLPLDPTQPMARRQGIIDQAKAEIIIDPSFYDQFVGYDKQLTEPVLPKTDSIAYVIFTSGSTGQPKGVVIQHQAAANTIDDINQRFEVNASDAVFALSRLSFDLSVYDIFGPLAVGGALVIPDADANRDPSHWLDLIDKHPVTLWNTVPALMDMLVTYCEGQAEHFPASLRVIMLSGDWIPLPLPQRIRDLHPDTVELISMGGATEASIWSIIYPIHEIDPSWSSVPYGKAMANQSWHVLHKDLRPCPVWVPGDLYIGGVGLALEYHGDVERTAASFMTHPATGERLYRTGDMGRFLPDGTIEFMGREDFQVKIQGYRIELGDIEAALLESDAVGNCVVDAPGKTPQSRRLVAYVIPREGESLDEDKLRDALAESLPAYMIPAAFVAMDSFPLTANGKVDRKALPEPDVEHTSVVDDGLMTPLQRQLSETWSALLGVDRVPVNADFFALGGNSLMAIQMVTQLQQSEGLNLSLRDFFAKATVAGLADLVAQSKVKGDGENRAMDLPELEPAPESANEPFALNDIQSAYWMGRNRGIELGGVAAHFYFELDLVTSHHERIQKAWQKLVDRHDMLRVVIGADGRQRVLETTPAFEVHTQDLRGTDPSAPLAALREELSHQVIDTSQWPLFEIHLSLLDDQVCRVHFSFDLILADAWSAQLLFQDFTRLFHDPDLELEPLDLRFRDYLAAMERLPEKAVYQQSKAFWTERVPSLPSAPQLPLACDPGSIVEPRFERRSATVPAAKWDAIQARASQEGLTPSGLVLAAYAQVLAAWSASPHFCINVTTFNRLQIHPQIQQLVGDFTSLTLMEVQAQDHFLGNARSIQEQLWEDLDHRFYSGIDVMRDIAAHRGRAPGALMPVVYTSRLFKAQGGASLPSNDDGTPGHVVYSVSQTPQVWLDMQVYEEDGNLAWTWDNVQGLFPEGLIDQLFSAFHQFLIKLADSPMVWTQRQSLLPEEQKALIQSVNETKAELPIKSLHQAFFDQANARPDASAVIDKQGSLSYAVLAQQASRLATKLRKRGVGGGELVAVITEKGREQALATLAIMLADGAYLPIDPHWPQERRDYICDQAKARIVLTQSHLYDHIEFPPGRIIGYVDQPHDEAEDLLLSETNLDQLAYVIFTSGSTGKPKGVAITQGAAANTIADINQRFEVTDDDRALAVSNLSFDLSVYDLFGMFAAGGCVVMPEQRDNPDPAHWLAVAREHDVTLWNSVPALLDLSLSYAKSQNESMPGALRLVMLSGDWLPLDIHGRLQEAAPRAELYSLGGATEGSIWSIFHPVTEILPEWTSVPYGKPLANQTFYVMDRNFEVAPTWVPGPLFIGGDGVATCYWADPARTALSYIPDPFGEAGSRLYRTGDLGRYRPDGSIEFLGRADFQVKVQGHRIELGEIEAVLNQHESIKTSVVDAPWTDDRRGPGGSRILVAYVVAEGEAIDEEVLRMHLGEHLPQYMVPRQYMRLEALPLSANGKVDRKALPAPNAQVQKSGAAPEGPMEARIAGIWRDVLQQDFIARDANFFDLGGNSLLALKLLTRLRETFQVPITLQTLFENITIAKLAPVIESTPVQEGIAAESLPELKHDAANLHEPFPLTEVQQAYWIGRMEGIQGGSVAAHAYYELESDAFDLETFQAGFQKMIQRHDALRIVIDQQGQQRILKDVPPYHVALHDLSTCDEAMREKSLWATRERLSHQVLPTHQWPIFEVCASRLSEGRTRLHLSFDLLIADAWSSQVLFHDLALVMRGEGDNLEPLEVSFRDYVLAEHGLRKTERYCRSQEYWFNRIDTLPSGPQLPTLTREDESAAPTFLRHNARLEAETWKSLRGLANKANLTPSGLLLTAFSEVLARAASSKHFLLNLTTFNRMAIHPHVNNLMGDFTSLTLLAADMRGNDTFMNRARRLQEQLWSDLDHRQTNGVEVLREMVKRQSGEMTVRAPVVFTSRLFNDDEGLAQDEKDALFGRVIYSVSQTPQVWLDHQVVEEDGALTWTWDVVEGRFPDGLVEGMFRDYLQLLERLADDEATWHSTTAGTLLPPARPLPQPHADPEPRLLHIPVLEQAKRTPLAPAVISPVENLSYEQLVGRASRLAKELRECGAANNQLIAIIMDKSPEQVIAALAIQIAGAAYLPIDAGLPQDRIETLLQLGRVEISVTHTSGVALPDGVQVCYVPQQVLPQSQWDEACATVDAADLAYVIFTSGSTGMPKGVAMQHQATANTIVDINTRFAVGPQDRTFALSSLSFDLSVYDVFGLLSVGGAMVLPQKGTERDPAHWAACLHEHRVTLWNSVPALMEMLIQASDNDSKLRLPSSLRVVLMSGDWIPVNLPGRIHAQVPSCQVNSLGGATEAAIWSIIYPIGHVPTDWTSIPYGKAMDNQSFHVLDDNLQPCPTWVPGELYIGGVGLAREYWGDEDKTNAAFILHPQTGARLYRTGDHGRLMPDGNIEFLGRQDLQVKISGFRVELGEIERSLEDHPRVESAIVNAPYGSGKHRRLVAYVVQSENKVVEPKALSHSSDAIQLQAFDIQALPIQPLPVDQKRLSQFLGALRQVQPAGLAVPKYLYPSGGGLYPVQVFVQIGSKGFAGLSCGCYAYHPKEHKLLKLSDNVPDSCTTVDFALHLVGDLNAIAPMYTDWGYNFLHLEAGYMSHLLQQTARELQIPLQNSGHHIFANSQVELQTHDHHVWCSSFQIGEGACTQMGQLPDRSQLDWSHKAIKDPVQRLTFKMELHGLPRPQKVLGVQELSPIELDDIQLKKIEARRSVRAFASNRIELEAFGRWLSPFRNNTDFQILLHLTPGKVDGLSGGYRYLPKDHALESVDAEMVIPREGHGPINRPIHDTAAFTIVMIPADRSMGQRHNDRLRREAGAIGQHLFDLGIRENIGICPLGGVDLTSFVNSFNLKEYTEAVHIFIGGANETDVSLADALAEQSAIQRKMMAEMAQEDTPEQGGFAPVLQDDASFTQVLKDHLEQHLPHYMVPASFHFINALPLTANGKVNRKALDALEAKTAKTSSDPSGGQPKNALEKAIAKMVGEILSLGQMSTSDNFFELGANSLQLVQLQGALQDHLGRPVPITDVFANPSVVALAEALSGEDTDAREEGRDRARKRLANRGARRKKERGR